MELVETCLYLIFERFHLDIVKNIILLRTICTQCIGAYVSPLWFNKECCYYHTVYQASSNTVSFLHRSSKNVIALDCFFAFRKRKMMNMEELKNPTNLPTNQLYFYQFFLVGQLMRNKDICVCCLILSYVGYIIWGFSRLG